jgi:NADPH-dependent curcumin reductase CurA
VDLALDYKDPQFYDEFSRLDLLADVYFDNVGGEILNFMMTRMNLKGRIVLCGALLLVFLPRNVVLILSL